MLIACQGRAHAVDTGAPDRYISTDWRRARGDELIETQDRTKGHTPLLAVALLTIVTLPATAQSVSGGCASSLNVDGSATVPSLAPPQPERLAAPEPSA